MNISTIHTHIAALAARIGIHPGLVYSGLGIVAMLALAAVVGALAPAPQPITATVPAQTETVAVVPIPVAPAVAATAPPATTAAPPDPVVPGIAPPNDLSARHATYILAAAPEPDRGEKVAAADWSQIGSAVVDARTAQYGALAAPLSAMLPSDGQVRETWRWWAVVPDEQGGDWLLVLRAQGPHDGVARVTVDGRAALRAETHARESTAVATLALGAGWHEITLTYRQPITQDRDYMIATIELFWRGPGASAPSAIEPYAVVAAPETPDASSTTPEPASTTPEPAK